MSEPKRLTEEQQRVRGFFEQGKLAPEGTTVEDCQAIAAWYLDTQQDFKAVIALQEAKRIGRVPGDTQKP